MDAPNTAKANPRPITSLRPLCVDLDGSLVRNDTAWDGAVLAARANPLNVFRMIAMYLRGGRAPVKEWIFRTVELDPATLPYQDAVLAAIKSARSEGRPIFLVTGSDLRMAERVAAHLGLFNGVMASDGSTNLVGQAKAARMVRDFGPQRFDYIGNSSSDLHPWKESSHAFIISRSRILLSRLSTLGVPTTHLQPSDINTKSPWLAAMRPHQWSKNVLLLAPWALAHRSIGGAEVLAMALAFVSFSLGASFVYILNDLVDIEHDRHHPKKRWRPLASGALQVPAGLLAATIMIVASLVLGLQVSWEFTVAVVGYLLLTTAYSFYLKSIPLLDIMVIASLFTWRIFAGAIALKIPVSGWLSVFSMFFFFGLAAVKRISELTALSARGKSEAIGRGFVVGDLPLLTQLATTASGLSVLVFALYINSSAVVDHYSHVELLWLVCPLLFYWLMRVLLITVRGEMHYDPIVFALRDRPSWLVLGLIGILLGVAI